MDIFVNWFLNTVIRVDPAIRGTISLVLVMFAAYCIFRMIKDFGDKKKPGIYIGWLILMIIAIALLILYNSGL